MQIWKYPFHVIDGAQRDFNIPVGAKPVHIAAQGDCVCIWMMVDPQAKKQWRRFEIVGTGHDIPDGHDKHYLGSAHLMDGKLVLHVFDVTE